MKEITAVLTIAPDIAYESGLRAACRPDIARWSNLAGNFTIYSQENRLIFVSPDLPSHESKKIRGTILIAACIRPIELLTDKNCMFVDLPKHFVFLRYIVVLRYVLLKKNLSVCCLRKENSTIPIKNGRI